MQNVMSVQILPSGRDTMCNNNDLSRKKAEDLYSGSVLTYDQDGRPVFGVIVALWLWWEASIWGKCCHMIILGGQYLSQCCYMIMLGGQYLRSMLWSVYFLFAFLYSRYFVQDVVHENSVHYTLLPMMVNMLQSCELFFRSTQATNDLKTCSCLKAKFTRLVHNVKPTAPTYKVFMTMIPQYYLTTSTMHDKLCTKFKLLKT